MNNDFENQINSQEQNEVIDSPEEEVSPEEVKEKMLADIDMDSSEVFSEGEEITGNINDLNPEESNNLADIKTEIIDLRNETKKEIEELFKEQRETPENFKNAARVLLNALKEEEESAIKGYVFTLGSSTEQTSQGKDVNVESLSWMSDDGFVSGFKNKQRVVLVATDKIDGQILGLRLADVRDEGFSRDENGDYFSKMNVTGEILTRQRGEGLATAIDKSFFKVITNLANHYKQDYPGKYQFNWEVDNANLKRFEEKKAKGISDMESNDLELEQKRWQSVYGENGKLDFKKIDDYKYSKIVEPKPEEGVSYDMKKVDFEKYKKIEEALEECVE